MTSVGTVISYPIPPYQNLAIQPQFYQPSRFVISDLTIGQTTIVITSEDHNYVIGQEVRLLIPANCGSYQLNNSSGYVLSIPDDDQVEISIDSSRNVNSFISATGISEPQILAVGDVNQGAINSNGRILNGSFVPGSFIDISPN